MGASGGSRAAATFPFVSGQLNFPPGQHGNHTPTLNRLELVYYDLPSSALLTQLYFWVITAAASSFYRPVIYSDNGSMLPVSLLVDGGQVDTSTTGLKNTAAFGALATGGPKWVGGILQGASGVVLQGHGESTRGMAASTLGGNVGQVAYILDGVSGAPPSSFGSTRTLGNGACRVFYK